MDKRWLISLFGAVLVCCGIFMPVLSVPVLGNINYLLCGRGDGTILVALAVISLLFARKNRYRLSWYMGIASFGVVIVTYAGVYKRLSALDALTAKEYHLSWGWAVLVAGIATLMAAASFREKASQVINSPAVSER